MYNRNRICGELGICVQVDIRVSRGDRMVVGIIFIGMMLYFIHNDLSLIERHLRDIAEHASKEYKI